MFKARDSLYVNTDWSSKFLEFVCRNCGKRLYRYAFVYRVVKMPTKESNGTASMMKMGQIPAFGPKTPARVLRLIQSDRELFLQGRRAENRGLGIGAFAYYRRVVENQRNRIIQEIAKAAKVVGTTAEIDSLFIEALNQFQFSKSVEMLEGFIPQALLIRGENPLVLLHSALSKGLHSPEMTDEHCLELAQSIRIVLTELAERVSSVTKDDKEIQEALKVLKGIPRGSKSNDQIVAEKPLDTIPSISMGEFQSEGARELTSTAEPVEAEARFIPPY